MLIISFTFLQLLTVQSYSMKILKSADTLTLVISQSQHVIIAEKQGKALVKSTLWVKI